MYNEEWAEHQENRCQDVGDDGDALGEILRREISQQGPISFARFMELALYHPRYGYYEKTVNQIGFEGDFITGVSIGPWLSRLIAFQFARWTESRRGGVFHWVEAAAHDGSFAAAWLSWVRDHYPELYKNTRYTILEPSDRRRSVQTRKLSEFAGHVFWLKRVEDLHFDEGEVGFVFSHELLDAFPFHLLQWDAGSRRWAELGVGLTDDQLAFKPLAACSDTVACPELPLELARVLPDGFILEDRPAVRKWWVEAAKRLREGFLMTIDYGLPTEAFLMPERRQGTFRGYQCHQLINTVLSQPGSVDITAHIDTDELVGLGESVGLKTEVNLSQERFVGGLAPAFLSSLAASAKFTQEAARGLQTLMHPEHFGRRFQVVIQRR